MILGTIFLIFFLAGTVLSFLVFVRSKEKTFVRRLIPASVVFAVFNLVPQMTSRCLLAPIHIWNNLRLSGAFILANHYPLYDKPGVPFTGWIYGPLAAVAYLPSVLATTPTTALWIASTIAAIFFFVPVFILFLTKLPPSQRVIGLAGAVLFCYLSFLSPQLDETAFLIHGDSPALGLSLLSLWFALRGEKSSNIFLSALFAVLSVFCKQVILPIFFVVPLYYALSGKTKLAARYFAAFFVVGVVAAGVSVLSFGATAFKFNVLDVPARIPWISPETPTGGIEFVPISLGVKLRLLAKSFVYFAATNSIFIALCLTVGLSFLFKKRKTPSTFDPATILVALAAILMAPLAILGSAKAGSGMNALSSSVYYLVLCTCLIFSSLAARAAKSNEAKFEQILLVVALIFLPFTQANWIWWAANRFPSVKENQEEVAFNYLRHHVGKIYFPRNPVSSLMTEGKLFPISYGISDLHIANLPIDEVDFQKLLPQRIDLLALPLGTEIASGVYFIRKFYPELREKVELVELPGFVVYRRPISER